MLWSTGRGRRARSGLATAATVALGLAAVGLPPAHAQSGLVESVVGLMSEPFEEGGPSPGCWDDNRRVRCKPTAVTTAALPTGRVLYANGIEGTENVRRGMMVDFGEKAVDDQSRVLDLTGSEPRWSLPGNNNGAGENPNIKPGRDQRACLEENPQGVLGVPGRPGDGLVGSAAGAAGAPESDPSCSPDDPADNDAAFFCADIVNLPDGRPMVVGGTDWYNEPVVLSESKGDPASLGIVEVEGLRTARAYNDAAGRWERLANTKYPRWYPGMITLGDGRVLAVAGTAKLIKSTQGSQVRRTETYDPAANTWTENYVGPASENSLPQNPRLFVAPNGKVFYTGNGQMWGPFGQSADEALFGIQQSFDPQTKEWEVAGVTVPVSSPAETTLPLTPPYDKLRILSAGGVLGPNPGSHLATPRSMVTTVTNDGKVSAALTEPLRQPRWFGQPTQLPDGTVLVTSGANLDEVIAPGTGHPVKQPEIFNPETGTWTQVATQHRERTYHNSALLLADGRVLIGGHSPIPTLYGPPGDVAPGATSNNDKDASFEIYSPPYLFNGPRPHIDKVQAGLRWGEQFVIETTDADAIEKVMLVRLSSPQHVMDNDARSIEVAFTKEAGRLVATAPPNGNIAVPGAYYLFINQMGSDGKTLVPSVARTVFVGEHSSLAEAPQPMTNEPTTLKGASPTQDHNQATQTMQTLRDVSGSKVLGLPARRPGWWPAVL